jgi:ubiquinone/menaquinone biosynthesis C-methylase UbiE
MKAERFEDFFRNKTYLSLKNHLYNYRIRKKAVARELASIHHERILEIGCGISPLTKGADSIVYLDISPVAFLNLKAVHCGRFATADAACLPFREGVFDTVICSEVLEHLHDDLKAIEESARVLRRGGSLLLTFPHQDFYFSADDRFVGHYRRYRLEVMDAMIKGAGLYPQVVRKILGPMEKILMLAAVGMFRLWPQRPGSIANSERSGMGKTVVGIFKMVNVLLAAIVGIDARIVPRYFSTVLLIRAVKR